MARRVHSDADNLDWAVRRLWLPEALRPVGPRQIYTRSTRPYPQVGALVFLSPILSTVFGIPALAVLLPLRATKVTPWEVVAVAKPWGRFGPRRVQRWRVKGWQESARAVDEIAAALAAGTPAGQILPAHRFE